MNMTTVPVPTGDTPEKPSLDPVTPDHVRGKNLPAGAPQYVGLDELWDCTSVPVIPEPRLTAELALVPPCRWHQRPGWDFLHRVVFGERAHTWRVLLLMLGGGLALSGVLLAGSVLVKAAALSLVSLAVLHRLGKNRTVVVQQA
ncbi:hypothetical protein [Amycolatopsis sp. H20-H5]|uniref:hypothetical protein n=1 Tax=Amycolatopsis sp. H20-H5 TaxID=3046309 RepID=UPI002DB9F60D|nr:hypothetical protein [Amycolatopsis sp. H20-H5]MEC3978152.1 hypothetical protein [Amycolatopsis sp. H20-H5]